MRRGRSRLRRHVVDHTPPQESTATSATRQCLADNLVGSDGSIAIRICEEEFCRHLIKRFRKPIVSTSANFSGQPSPANFGEINEELKTKVDYIANYKSSNIEMNTSSDLVRWKNGEMFYLRQNR